MLKSGRLQSMILWGPPGCGKTTIARLLAHETKLEFEQLSAIFSGVQDLRKAFDRAKARREQGKGTLLFIDEIHRFNRSQQDSFLPHMEDGTITLVGATTENPSFAVNAPLLSRCKVFRLQLLDATQLLEILRRALVSPRGLDGAFTADDDALQAIAALAQGDARRALTTLEIAAAEVERAGETAITREVVAGSGEQKTLLYDKAGEEHYNVISAFIKSMRGSDPDGAIYWLMRMIEAGDDPLFLLRRMMIFASEDVGNADPRALELTVAADAAFRRMGMPEGMYPMAQAALYLATAPKSNACKTAWHKAQEAVHAHGALPVPMKLRNAVTKLMGAEGYGEGYRYAHDEEGGVATGEVYLPEELVEALAGERFYEPTDRGYEKQIAERVRRVRGEG
jgi:putative ATPase